MVRTSRGSLVCTAVLLLAAATGSGCNFTFGPGRWAAERVPASRVVGILRDEDGSANIVVRLRKVADRPEGLYKLRIPASWIRQPRHASPWGPDIESTPHLSTQPEQVDSVESGAIARVERLTLIDIVNGLPSHRGLTYGFAYVPNPSGYSIEVFGYDSTPVGMDRARSIVTRHLKKPAAPKRNPFGVNEHYLAFMSNKTDAQWGRTLGVFVAARSKRGSWVHLGGLEIDAGRISPARVPAAVLAYIAVGPFLMIADMVSLETGAFKKYETGEWPVHVPPILVPALVRKLEATSLADRGLAAAKLRDCGVLGLAAVPGLRQLALHSDSYVRSQALGTLATMDAIDMDTLAAMLASPDVPVRCDAVFHIGKSREPDVSALLQTALKDVDPTVRAGAWRAKAARCEASEKNVRRQ